MHPSKGRKNSHGSRSHAVRLVLGQSRRPAPQLTPGTTAPSETQVDACLPHRGVWGQGVTVCGFDRERTARSNIQHKLGQNLLRQEKEVSCCEDDEEAVFS